VRPWRGGEEKKEQREGALGRDTPICANRSPPLVQLHIVKVIYSELHTFTAVPTLYPPWHSKISVSFEAMVDVDDSSLLATHSPSYLAWSEGRQPLSTVLHSMTLS